MEILVKTNQKQAFIDITNNINKLLKIKNGICIVYCPHTTAGLTINEGADPNVKQDILDALDELTPKLNYKHMEGNSPAHIKSSLMGNSLNIIIENGELKLGTWQSIYFCEFDGPRQRKIFIKFLGDKN